MINQYSLSIRAKLCELHEQKLNICYAGKIMINKFGLLYNSFSSKYDGVADTADHVSKPESQFSCLESMNSPLEESTSVAILLPSLGSRNKYAPIIASVHTLVDAAATWRHVITIFVEEYRRLSRSETVHCGQ